jgi:hypothetical protein
VSHAGSPTPGSSPNAGPSRRVDPQPTNMDLAQAGPSGLHTPSTPPKSTPANRPVRTRKQPPRNPVVVAREAVSAARKAPNPLDALLREKRASERQGGGAAALALAERSAREGSAPVEDGEDDAALRDVEAARIAAQHGMAMRLAKGMENDENSEDVLVTAETANRFLGKEAGEAVGKILEQDRNEKVDDDDDDDGTINIWAKGAAGEEGMNADERLPSWDAPSGPEDPSFRGLRQALEANSALVRFVETQLLTVVFRYCDGDNDPSTLSRIQVGWAPGRKVRYACMVPARFAFFTQGTHAVLTLHF